MRATEEQFYYLTGTRIQKTRHKLKIYTRADRKLELKVTTSMAQQTDKYKQPLMHMVYPNPDLAS